MRLSFQTRKKNSDAFFFIAFPPKMSRVIVFLVLAAVWVFINQVGLKPLRDMSTHAEERNAVLKRAAVLGFVFAVSFLEIEEEEDDEESDPDGDPDGTGDEEEEEETQTNTTSVVDVFLFYVLGMCLLGAVLIFQKDKEPVTAPKSDPTPADPSFRGETQQGLRVTFRGIDTVADERKEKTFRRNSAKMSHYRSAIDYI